eukprot:jgi/Ulvmu1/10283/UM060_0085.1
MRYLRGAMYFAACICVLLLRLAIEPAAVVLAEANNMRQVTSPAELKQAIRAGASNIVFVSNITLDESMFPEPPATCLRNDTTVQSLMDCDEDVVIYAAQAGSESTQAKWTALDGVVLDAAFLFRGIILSRNLTIQGVTVARMLDDRNPFYFLFGFLNNIHLVMTGCTFVSPCGGRGPNDLVDAILDASPDDLQFQPSEQVDSSVLTVDTLQGVPIEGLPDSLIGSFRSRIECYDPTNSPFPLPVAPLHWNEGTADTQVNAEDTCFRPETLGADYRGTVNTTISGARCQSWSQPTAENQTMTPELLPTFGLGTAAEPHSFCRNPDHSDLGPWCYVAGPGGGREFCDVEACPIVVQPPSVTGLPADGESIDGGSSSKGGLSTAAKWGIIAAAAVLGLLVFIGVWGYCRERGCPCLDVPVRTDYEKELVARHELEHPRADVTVELDGSSALDGSGMVLGHKGFHVAGVHAGGLPAGGIASSASGLSNGAGLSPASVMFEGELRRTMGDGGSGQTQLQVLDEIGRGAYGVVHRGSWKTLRVTIKKIPFPGGSGGSAPTEYANSAWSCAHPNIIKTFHCEIQAVPASADGVVRDEILYMAHEYCDGGNLEQAIQAGFFLTSRSPLDFHQRHIIQVVWELAVGLQYVHSRNDAHGDLHPRNVLFKGYVQSARASAKTLSVAEAHTQAPVREVYASLARGFITKITDSGLALKMWGAGEDLPAHYDETLRFYTAPEVLEYNTYSKAADVYSLGAILWEILHSKPCYRRTVVGFPVRHPDFPKFAESAPLPYAALTAACLHSNPSLRPTMDEVVAVLQDLFTVPGEDSAHLSQNGDGGAAADADGGTRITDLVRRVLGNDAEVFRKAPHWRGVLEDLNGISSDHILDLLTKVKLTDIINLPAPTQGPPQAPKSASAASPSRAAAAGGLSPLGNGHAVHPGAQRAARQAWDDSLLPGADDEDGYEPVAAAAGASSGAARSAPFQPTALQSTLDTSPELGHTMRRTDSVTSAEESDDFQDAMEELVSDGSFFMGGHSGEGHSRSSQKGRRSRHANAAAGSNAGQRMRPLEHQRGLDGLAGASPSEMYGRDATGRASIGSTGTGAAASSSAAMLRRPRSGGQTPPVTGDLVSSRSNVSVYSDWDHMEGRAMFVKDDFTGKTHLQMNRVAQAARARKDTVSHGAHLSSTALTSATSAAESAPGTPENSHTIDAMLGERADALTAGDGVQSISGEVAGALLDLGVHSVHSGRAVVTARRPSLNSANDHSPSNSERLLAHEALMVPHQQRPRPPLPPGAANDAGQDVDEESQLDVLRWAPAARAQSNSHSRGASRLPPGGALDSHTHSQVSASHPNSGASQTSQSSLVSAQAAAAAAAAATALSVGRPRVNEHGRDSAAVPAAARTSGTTLDRLLPAVMGPRSTDFPHSAPPEAPLRSGLRSSESSSNAGGSAVVRNSPPPPRMTPGPHSSDTLSGTARPPVALGALRSPLSADGGDHGGPSIVVKGRPARSVDGTGPRLSNAVGEYRPMVMRGDRANSFTGDVRSSGAAVSGNVASFASTRLSPVASRADDGPGSQKGMGLRSLFDSFNGSEADEPLSARDLDGTSGTDATTGGAPPNSTTGAAADPAVRAAANGDGERPTRASTNKAKRSKGANGLDAALGLSAEAANSSGSDGSPLSMRGLDVSHVGSSIDAHSPADAASFEAAAAMPTGTAELMSPALSTASTSAVVPAAAPASGGSGVGTADGIDLKPKAGLAPGVVPRRSSSSGGAPRMPSDMLARQHGGRRGGDGGPKLPSSSGKGGKAPLLPSSKEEPPPGSGKAANVKNYVHPLLRNNKAAIAHVERIQRRGTNDGSGNSSEQPTRVAGVDSADDPRGSAEARSPSAPNSYSGSAERAS